MNLFSGLKMDGLEIASREEVQQLVELGVYGVTQLGWEHSTRTRGGDATSTPEEEEAEAPAL